MPPCCRTCRLPKHHIPRCRPERAPLPAHAYIPSQDELQEAGQSCTYPYLCDQTVGCRFSNLSNADAIEGHARPYPMYHVAWLQKEWIPGQIRSLAWTWTKVSPDAADTPDHLPPFPSPSSPFSFQQRCRSLVIRPLATRDLPLQIPVSFSPGDQHCLGRRRFCIIARPNGMPRLRINGRWERHHGPIMPVQRLGSAVLHSSESRRPANCWPLYPAPCPRENRTFVFCNSAG